MANRIQIVDILRGFALLGVTLAHFGQQFSLSESNTTISTFIDLFISQKAFMVFCVMFGFSAYKQRGVETYNIRMLLLMVIGVAHGAFYNGDILFLYGVFGLLTGLVRNIEVGWLYLIAAILFVLSFVMQAFPIQATFESQEVFASADLLPLIKYNLFQGRLDSLVWSFNSGRIALIPSLFILGYISGKIELFERLYLIKTKLVAVCTVAAVLSPVLYVFCYNCIPILFNAAMVVFVITLVCLMCFQSPRLKVWTWLASYGRTGLTNYVLQGVIGTVIFYGFGFSAHSVLSCIWSVVLGMVVFAVQMLISVNHMRVYRYGILEIILKNISNSLHNGLKKLSLQEK